MVGSRDGDLVGSKHVEKCIDFYIIFGSRMKKSY